MRRAPGKPPRERRAAQARTDDRDIDGIEPTLHDRVLSRCEPRRPIGRQQRIAPALQQFFRREPAGNRRQRDARNA